MTKPKSRMAANRPRVIVREQCDHDDLANHQRLSHVNGIFDDSGYSSGRGQFGFRHDIGRATRPPLTS